jgi:hypothetical protein
VDEYWQCPDTEFYIVGENMQNVSAYFIAKLTFYNKDEN